MQLKAKVGLVLVILGIGVLSAWNWWTKTRNFLPVSIPIFPISGQTITSEFKLNFDGLYLIEIQAEQTMPPDTLHCLMGLEFDAARCKDTPSAIAATWILSANNHELQRGSSAEQHSAPVDSGAVTRVIGEFQGKSGQAYKLEVAFTVDGASLAPAHSRLQVAVASIAYTDLQSAAVLVFSIGFICMLFGAILLGIALYARRRADLL